VGRASSERIHSSGSSGSPSTTGYDPRFQREAIAPIQNKLGQFLSEPRGPKHLRPSPEPREHSLRHGSRAESSSRTFGQGKARATMRSQPAGFLLTTQFQLAAMARANDAGGRTRRDFYLFIDEFQNFGTDAFASILAEARKYRLCLTISHQYIDQLSLPGSTSRLWERRHPVSPSEWATPTPKC
jgi:hypothetical protein